MANIIDVKVPNIGDFEEVEIIEVSVSNNQTIEQEQSLITLETDKAAMEVPSPHAGKVTKIMVNTGDKVKEGDVILQLEVEGQAPEPTTEDKGQDKVNDQAVAQTSEEAPSQQSEPQPSGEQTITLPDLGTDDEVLVIEWQVSPGDTVEIEQSVMTLESDKASMDVPSPYAGTLKKQLVEVGSKVKSNQPVAVIETTSQAKQPSVEPAKPDTTKASAPTPASQPVAQKPAKVLSDVVATTGEVHAGPSVRRLAHELGVDLAKVKGTGHKGRILASDVHAFVKQALRQGPPGTGIEPMPQVDFSKWGEVDVRPLSRIKKLTAKNLHRNWVNIPHVTQFDEADISELEQFRNDNKASAKALGFGLTPLAFIIKACVSSLQAFEQFNSSLDVNGADLIYKKYYHIGFAVDTPNGLVVPVIRDVDKKGLFAIASELNELGQKARDGKLSRDDMQGSCFSVSSLGSIGGTSFTPIINAPDVAILGVSKAQMKPVYDGEGFVPKLMLPLSLSYDHRVIDGAEAARFCRHLCTQLEDIRKLLL